MKKTKVNDFFILLLLGLLLVGAVSWPFQSLTAQSSEPWEVLLQELQELSPGERSEEQYRNTLILVVRELITSKNLTDELELIIIELSELLKEKETYLNEQAIILENQESQTIALGLDLNNLSTEIEIERALHIILEIGLGLAFIIKSIEDGG